MNLWKTAVAYLSREHGIKTDRMHYFSYFFFFLKETQVNLKLGVDLLIPFSFAIIINLRRISVLADLQRC